MKAETYRQHFVWKQRFRCIETNNIAMVTRL